MHDLSEEDDDDDAPVATRANLYDLTTPSPNHARRGDEALVRAVDVVDLVDDDDNDVLMVRAASDDDNNDDDDWPCPRCTFLNPVAASACAMCSHVVANNQTTTTGATIVRPPDPTRRERLVDGGGGRRPDRSPLAVGEHHAVGGGTLLGGILGGAGAYMRGNPVGEGVVNGAFSGAVGGMLLSEVFRDDDDFVVDETSRRFGSNDDGFPPYEQSFFVASSDDEEEHRSPRYRRRASASWVPRGAASSSSSSSTTTSRAERRRRLSPEGAIPWGLPEHHRSTERTGRVERERLLRTLRRLSTSSSSSTTSRRASAPPRRPGTSSVFWRDDLDDMDYDQLLDLFGDGNERRVRGASRFEIESLPSKILGRNVDAELPPDKRECHVCLETFRPGDDVRTLPCLHSYHKACIDRWLGTNACCPVCKHRINE